MFARILPAAVIRNLFRLCGPACRRPPKITAVELIMGLVWHVLQGAGHLAENVRVLTRKKISDSALSQRRTALPWQIFESILEAALSPKAKPKEHPEAFYHGLRLCGTDGSSFSVAHTPQVKQTMTKAVSAHEN